MGWVRLSQATIKQSIFQSASDTKHETTVALIVADI